MHAHAHLLLRIPYWAARPKFLFSLYFIDRGVIYRVFFLNLFIKNKQFLSEQKKKEFNQPSAILRLSGNFLLDWTNFMRLLRYQYLFFIV